MKPRHYLVFWSLYNDLCIDDEYFRYYSRRDLVRALRAANPLFDVSSITAVLGSLHEYGYIECHTHENRSIGTGVQAYEIRIHPQAWSKSGPKKRPSYRTPEQQRMYNQARKARLQAQNSK